MNKIAVLVLGCFAPLVLDRVLGAFADERFKFFLHLDAKEDLEAYLGQMQHRARLQIVTSRIPIFWGGFSMVQAEIKLAQAALADPEISSMILLSDDTAPLFGPDKIYQALSEVPDRITCQANGRPRHWYSDFYYPDSKFSSLRGIAMDHRQLLPVDFQNILQLEKLRAKGKKNIPILYFGRQWWALSRASLTKILAYLQADSHFMESFRFSLFPDETFFPTAYRTCFPHTETIDIPVFAEYNKHVHPWLFTSAAEIKDTKMGPEHLFVRKIKPSMPEIIDELAAGFGFS
jgi:hypothetical protein